MLLNLSKTQLLEKFFSPKKIEKFSGHNISLASMSYSKIDIFLERPH
jgi:hypothetical protein